MHTGAHTHTHTHTCTRGYCTLWFALSQPCFQFSRLKTLSELVVRRDGFRAGLGARCWSLSRERRVEAALTRRHCCLRLQGPHHGCRPHLTWARHPLLPQGSSGAERQGPGRRAGHRTPWGEVRGTPGHWPRGSSVRWQASPMYSRGTERGEGTAPHRTPGVMGAGAGCRPESAELHTPQSLLPCAPAPL